jgi:hypothetical protein
MPDKVTSYPGLFNPLKPNITLRAVSNTGNEAGSVAWSLAFFTIGVVAVTLIIVACLYYYAQKSHEEPISEEESRQGGCRVSDSVSLICAWKELSREGCLDPRHSFQVS